MAIAVPTVRRWLAGEDVSAGSWIVAAVAGVAALGVVVVWGVRLWGARRR